MARPVQDPLIVTADPKSVDKVLDPMEPGSPSLSVDEPLNAVNGQPSAAQQSWEMLSKAVGVASSAYGDYKQQKDVKDTKDGTADGLMNQVDPARQASSDAYAKAAHQGSVISQTQDVFANLDSEIPTKIDHTLPVPQQVAQIDAMAKSELGDLAKDPDARDVIAPRYQAWITEQANKLNSEQASNLQKNVTDATMSDIGQQATAGTLTPQTWSDGINRVAAVTGDRPAAIKAQLQSIGQLAITTASTGGDWQSILKQIPTSLVDDKGNTLPSPLASPENAEIVRQATKLSQQAQQEFQKPQFLQAQAAVYSQADQLIRNGVSPTEGTMRQWVASGYITPEQMGSFQMRAEERADALAKEHQSDKLTLPFGPNWTSNIGTPIKLDKAGNVTDTYSKEDAQRSFDAGLQSMLAKNGTDASQLVQNPTAMQQLATMSAQYKLPLSSVQATLSNVNSGNAAAVVANLPAYKILKAQGVAGMYVTSEAAAKYESVLDAQSANVPADGIQKMLLQADDPARKEAVTAGLAAANKAAMSGTVPGSGYFGSDFRGTSRSDQGNSPYVNYAMSKLNATFLRLGNTPEDAATKAQGVFDQQHVVIPINGQPTPVPIDKGGTAYSLQTTVPLFERAIPSVSKRLGVDPSTVHLAVDTAVSGVGTEFYYADQLGHQIAGTPRWTPDEMLRNSGALSHTLAADDQAAAKKAAADTAAMQQKALSDMQGVPKL